MAQEPAEPDPFGGEAAKSLVGSTVTERNQATELLLDTLEVDFPFAAGKPLQEVLAELHAATGLKFVIDASATDGDLNPGTKITFSADALRLRTGLDLMLDTFQCTYTIRDGLLLLISQDAAANPDYFRLKAFDVQELLQLMIRAEQLRDKEVVRPASPWYGGTGGMSGTGGGPAGGGMFSLMPSSPPQESDQPAGGETTRPAAESAIQGQPAAEHHPVRTENRSAQEQAQQKLIDFIQANIAPDDWGETGQGDGTIQAIGGVLIVGQSESVLHAVDVALDDLQRKLRTIETRQAK
jgi:hypothetical protein